MMLRRGSSHGTSAQTWTVTSPRRLQQQRASMMTRGGGSRSCHWRVYTWILVKGQTSKADENLLNLLLLAVGWPWLQLIFSSRMFPPVSHYSPLPHIRNGRSLFNPTGNPVLARDLLIYPQDQESCKLGELPYMGFFITAWLSYPAPLPIIDS